MNPIDNDKDWRVTDYPDCTVIIPRQDIKTHLEKSIHCPCKPDVAIYNPYFDCLCPPLICHYSFRDGQRLDRALKELFQES